MGTVVRHGSWLLAALVAASGCRPREDEPAGAAAPTVEPVLPTARLSASPNELPPWAEALPPAGERPIAVGSKVWATVPQTSSPLARVGVFTVESSYDSRLSLTDRMGQRVDGVPAALVHPTKPRGKLEEGQLVLCYAWTLPGVLARVAKLSAGSEIEVLYDAAGSTQKAAIEHAEAPVEGIAPLAFVEFPKAGKGSRGLVLALSDDRAWVRTESGHVEIHERRTLKPLPLPAAELAVGQAVRAFRWATGFSDATVAAVLEPGLRYRVRLPGNRAEEDMFFTSLVK